jgi:tetratricopeptide (TPR) repeat protein/energy-coupling factor transporter ATP-binding protein EcfA2
MSVPFTVFVSSTFDDLEPEREAVLDAIRRVQQRHDAVEFFGADTAQPIETCLREVRKSDLLVVIVGFKYGRLPSGMGISYSQAEYEEAIRHEKPCLVYLRDDDIPILPKYVERDPDRMKRLEAWKGRLQSAHTAASFKDADDLALQVAADVGRVLVVFETSKRKGVSEAPLREVLKRLDETEVAEAEIPDRLAKAADELIRLRTDLARLSNERPEFAAIRTRASALIDKGDFDAARAALNEGRQGALRAEASRTEAGFLADEARVDRLQLNYDAACAKFAEAARLDPDNVWLWIELGDLWVLRGSLAEARSAFFTARDAAIRSGADRDLAASYERLGGVQFAQGDLARAMSSYHDSLTIRDRLTQSDPGNAQGQRDLYASHTFVGSVKEAQGDLAGALGSYRDGFAIIDRLAKSDPGNLQWQRDLSVSYEKIGDVQLAQGDLADALKSYQADLAIAVHLANSDPGNAGWRRDLSESYNKIGDVQRAQGDLAGALQSFRDSLAIVDHLAQSNPGNSGWRDLSGSYDKIGDVLVAQRDLAGALNSYRDSLAIFDRLAKSEPGNASSQRYLSLTLSKVGDVQVAQGELADALVSYLDSFGIRERFVKVESENVEWPGDLAVSHSKILSAFSKNSAVSNDKNRSSVSFELLTRLALISRERGAIFASLAINDNADSARSTNYRTHLEFIRFQRELEEQLFLMNLASVFELKTIELRNTMIFADIFWHLTGSVNVLLGRNGFGKSLLLRLTAGVLARDDDKLTLLLSTSPEDQLLTLRLLRNNNATPILRDKLSFAEPGGKIPVLAIPDSRFVNRVRQGFGTEDEDSANPAKDGARHFLYDLPFEARLQTVFAQMCIEYINVRGGKSEVQSKPSTPQLDLVAAVIQELSGETFEFYRIEPIGGARFSIEVLTDASPGKPISFQHASQGTLSVVAIFALIYQFLKAVHTDVSEADLCNQTGIVIVDEVDAHLHPAWQRRIVELLRKRFPKIQFVLTAHSPLVVAGCRHGEVAVLRRNNSNFEIKHIPRDFAGVSPEEIYGQVFEIEDKDVRFLELHAQIPQLPELLEDLERQKKAGSVEVGELEEAIRAIERTREQRSTSIDYETLRQENQQLRRQLGAPTREIAGTTDK